MVAECSELFVGFFFLQYHEPGKKKHLRNLIEIATRFIEEQSCGFLLSNNGNSVAAIKCGLQRIIQMRT